MNAFFSYLFQSVHWLQLRSSSLHHLQQERNMSKMSHAARKRMPLTTKRAHKGFYKGKGGTKEGRLTSKGKFMVDPFKKLELIIPDLTGFKVCFYARVMCGDERSQCMKKRQTFESLNTFSLYFFSFFYSSSRTSLPLYRAFHRKYDEIDSTLLLK